MRNVFKALQSAWAAGCAQFYRVRSLQKRASTLNTPF